MHEQRLETLIAAYRSARGSDALTDERIVELFRLEEERVASAVTLSEVLVPLLAEVLRTSPAGLPDTRHRAPDHRGDAAQKAARSAGGASIADFIDGMLAQDDAASSQRRRK